MSSDTRHSMMCRRSCAWGSNAARVMPDTDWQSANRKRGTAGVATMARPDCKQRPGAIRHSASSTRLSSSRLSRGLFDALQLSDIDDLMLTDPPRIRLVFVNGYLASGLCAMAKSLTASPSAVWPAGSARCRQCSGSSWTQSPSTTMFCGAQQCADVGWGVDSPGGRGAPGWPDRDPAMSVGLE